MQHLEKLIVAKAFIALLCVLLELLTSVGMFFQGGGEMPKGQETPRDIPQGRINYNEIQSKDKFESE